MIDGSSICWKKWDGKPDAATRSCLAFRSLETSVLGRVELSFVRGWARGMIASSVTAILNI